MRRKSLSTKLLIAVLPLVLALGGLLAVIVRDGLREVGRANLGAELGATWEPLVTTMRAIETERVVSTSGDAAAIREARRVTNQWMVEMDTSLRRLGESQPLLVQLGQALSSIGLARGAVDDPAQGVARGLSADDSFNAAKADLVAVGRLLPTEASSEELARALTAVAALAEIEQGSIVVLNSMQQVLAGGGSAATFDRMVVQIDRVDRSVDLFRATADGEWSTDFRQTGFARALGDTRRTLVSGAPTIAAADVERLSGPVERIADLRDGLALDVVEASRADARSITIQTWLQVAVTAVAILLALGLAYLVSRSITRRVKAVSGAAQEVTTDRLPVLVDALRDPRGRTELPEVVHIDERGADELAELARSFNTLQTTLGDVAHEQIDVLRRGVSDIFVTMARRNRSLVDRQLALLDELESGVEDPDVLADYYRLDHLATRMRRNSESLLVLANSETMRRRSRPAPIDDVVRAAISEVEDYRRIDIVTLEHLNVRGAVVADVAHLAAELLDNATAFSPPTSRVRITGDLIDGEYRILIMDDGVGISGERIAELNDLLAHPPVLGLSVEPTLGMSVVSLLAAKHGVRVELAQGAPGTMAKVVLPESAFERRLLDRYEPDADAAASSTGMPAPSLSSSMSPPPDRAPESVSPAANRTDEPAETATSSNEGAEDRWTDAPTRSAPPRRKKSRREKTRRATARPAKSRREKPAEATKPSRKERRQQEKAAGRTKKAARDDRRTADADRAPAAEHGGPGPTAPSGVVGDPLSIRLTDVVGSPDVGPSDDLVALARRHAEQPTERGDETVHTDVGGRVPDGEVTSESAVVESLPTRLPRRERTVEPPAATTGEDALDLANLDITPAWARSEQEGSQAGSLEGSQVGPTVPAAPIADAPPLPASPPVPVQPAAPEVRAAPEVEAAPEVRATPEVRAPAAPSLPPPATGPVPAAPGVPSGAPVSPPPPAGVPSGAPVPPPPPPPGPRIDLPVRSRSTGPSDHGEDRLDRDGVPVTTGGRPSELKAALAAFDSGRRGAGPESNNGHRDDPGPGHGEETS